LMHLPEGEGGFQRAGSLSPPGRKKFQNRNLDSSVVLLPPSLELPNPVVREGARAGGVARDQRAIVSNQDAVQQRTLRRRSGAGEWLEERVGVLAGQVDSLSERVAQSENGLSVQVRCVFRYLGRSASYRVQVLLRLPFAETDDQSLDSGY
jgi:hypothetical protein